MINKDSIQFHCDRLAETLIKKNHDYGNSVEEQFNEYGLASILIRLDDKMRRLKNLVGKDPQVIEESLIDTLQDLSGYATLGKICLVHSRSKKEANPLDMWTVFEKDFHRKPSYMDLDDE